MRASEWDGNQWPPPVVPDANLDHTGEPVGYYLDAIPLYEQPPLPPLHPWRVPAPRPVSSARVVTALGASVAGLVTVPILQPFSLTIAATGVLMCADVLIRSRRVGLRLRGLVIAGLVLGIICCLLTILSVVDFSTGSPVAVPG